MMASAVIAAATADAIHLSIMGRFLVERVDAPLDAQLTPALLSARSSFS
jgi:hypothetical protein